MTKPYIRTLTADETFWLGQVYSAFQQKTFIKPHLVKYDNKNILSPEFDYKNFDTNLITPDGCITLLGVIHAAQDDGIVSKADEILAYFKEVVVNQRAFGTLMVSDIAAAVGLTEEEVSTTIELLRMLKPFNWCISGAGGDFQHNDYPKLFKSVDLLDNRPELFEFYCDFVDVETTLTNLTK